MQDILNPNIEYRNSKQIQNSNSQMFKTKPVRLKTSFFGFGHLDFGNSYLFRISCFGFRIFQAEDQERRAGIAWWTEKIASSRVWFAATNSPLVVSNLGLWYLRRVSTLGNSSKLSLTLHTCAKEKRARVRQMWLRTGSDRSRRTLPYVKSCSEHSQRWGAIARAQRFWPV